MCRVPDSALLWEGLSAGRMEAAQACVQDASSGGCNHGTNRQLVKGSLLTSFFLYAQHVRMWCYVVLAGDARIALVFIGQAQLAQPWLLDGFVSDRGQARGVGFYSRLSGVQAYVWFSDLSGC